MRERRVVAETDRVPLTLTLAVVVDDADRVPRGLRVRRGLVLADLDRVAVFVIVAELVPLFVLIWLVVTVDVEITDFVGLLVLDSVGVAVDDLESLAERDNVALLVADKDRREDPLRVGELDPVLLMDALLVAVRLDVVVREVVEVDVPVCVDTIEVLARLLAVDDLEGTLLRVLFNDIKAVLVDKEDLVGKSVALED